MSPLAALLAGVLDFPADDSARLVYADALEETGEPEHVARAELIRLQVAGEGLDRQRGLLEEWLTAWLPPPLEALRFFQPGLLFNEFWPVLPDGRWDDRTWFSVRFERGFAGSVALKVEPSDMRPWDGEAVGQFAAMASRAIAAMLATHPLEEIAFNFGPVERYRVFSPAAGWRTCVGVANALERIVFAGAGREAFGQELTAKLHARLLHLGEHVLHLQRGERDP